MITDKEKFLSLMSEWGIRPQRFTRPDYIADEALANGCKESFNVHGVIDFAFDEKGFFIGHYTCSAKSWKSRDQ